MYLDGICYSSFYFFLKNFPELLNMQVSAYMTDGGAARHVSGAPETMGEVTLSVGIIRYRETFVCVASAVRTHKSGIWRFTLTTTFSPRTIKYAR